jgi:hypothetical protein
MILHDEKGNAVTLFPLVDGKYVVPVQLANQLISESYDYIEVFYPTDLIEVYVFKTGGTSGDQVAQVTVTYSTSTKERLTSVTKI